MINNNRVIIKVMAIYTIVAPCHNNWVTKKAIIKLATDNKN